MNISVGHATYQFQIKKSRFIGLAGPVSSPEEAKRWLQEIRRENPAARHVVHAFITGEAGAVMGMSDDGEPAGTAGKPVLEVLKGRELTNTAVLVVRYFGGVKLGTGGLVRAYAEAAREALDRLTVTPLIKMAAFSMVMPYSFFDSFKRVAEEMGCTLGGEEFAAQVSVTGELPAARSTAFAARIRDASAGQVAVEFSGEAGETR